MADDNIAKQINIQTVESTINDILDNVVNKINDCGGKDNELNLTKLKCDNLLIEQEVKCENLPENENSDKTFFEIDQSKVGESRKLDAVPFFKEYIGFDKIYVNDGINEQDDDTLKGEVEKDESSDEDIKDYGIINQVDEALDIEDGDTVDNEDEKSTIDEEEDDGSIPILKFLEAISHQIIFQRKIYPKSSFEKHTMFRLPVHMSIHPAVTNYISQSVASLEELVEEDHEIISFAIVITSDKTYEKLVIEADISRYAAEEFRHKDLLNVFTSVMKKLPLVARKFKHSKSPKDWWIEIITKEQVPLRMSSDFIWTESTCDTSGKIVVGCDDCLILPVLTIEKPFFVHIFLKSTGLVKRKLKYRNFRKNRKYL